MQRIPTRPQVPQPAFSGRCRQERVLEAKTQRPEQPESRESSAANQSYVDLTVVSGCVECFLVLTGLALLGLALRLLGILD